MESTTETCQQSCVKYDEGTSFAVAARKRFARCCGRAFIWRCCAYVHYLHYTPPLARLEKISKDLAKKWLPESDMEKVQDSKHTMRHYEQAFLADSHVDVRRWLWPSLSAWPALAQMHRSHCRLSDTLSPQTLVLPTSFSFSCYSLFQINKSCCGAFMV
eukprot:6204777-Pleurochrysis_carterae.AAC.12